MKPYSSFGQMLGEKKKAVAKKKKRQSSQSSKRITPAVREYVKGKKATK